MAAILDLIGSSIVGGLLLITILRTNMVAVDVQSFFTEDLMTQTNLRNTVKIIEYDFRKIGYGATFDPLNGNLPLDDIIFVADTDRIRFWADLDGDGVRDIIEYTFGGEDLSSENDHDFLLMRRVSASTDASLNCNYPITHGVTRFHLDYFGLSETRLSTPVDPGDMAALQVIQITLNMESPFITRSQFESDTVGYQKRSAMWRESRLVARNMTR